MNKMENIGLKRGYLKLYDYREDYPSIYEEAKKELLEIYIKKESNILIMLEVQV